MSNSRTMHDKVELYTRAILGAARGEDRANADLVQLQHARKFSPEVLEILATMQGSGDLDLVSDVVRQYQDYIDNDDRMVSVVVTTAVPLDDDLRQKIRSKAQAELGAPVFLVERVDPSILGGIIVEERGKRFDVSVRAQLANIRKTLSATFIGGDEND